MYTGGGVVVYTGGGEGLYTGGEGLYTVGDGLLKSVVYLVVEGCKGAHTIRY